MMDRLLTGVVMYLASWQNFFGSDSDVNEHANVANLNALDYRPQASGLQLLVDGVNSSIEYVHAFSSDNESH